MRWPLAFFVAGRPLPSEASGVTIGPVIFIRKGYENDEGLYQHELTHVKQAATLLFVGYALLYLLYKPFKLWSEANAYKAQMQYPDRFGNKMTLDTGAYRLSLPMYGLGLTIEQAKEYLVQ